MTHSQIYWYCPHCRQAMPGMPTQHPSPQPPEQLPITTDTASLNSLTNKTSSS
ncbi:MAG: hypothetical protein AAFV85_22245 [Cyanobacteria bacterium J06634_6]